MKFSALGFLLVPALANLHRRQAPPPDQITIISAKTSGNGCPQGTVSSSMSADRTVVTFGFDAFQVYIGPDTKQADRSKNCQIHLNLAYPGGFTYSVTEATYHGYARLDPGVTGTFLSTYFFSQNASNTANSRSSISGPTYVGGQVYTKTDRVENAAVVWSPCGTSGILNVNNRIALTSSDSQATGELSDDDATVAITHQINVQWRTCKG